MMREAWHSAAKSVVAQLKAASNYRLWRISINEASHDFQTNARNVNRAERFPALL